MKDFETAMIATEEALTGKDATKWYDIIKKEIIFHFKNGTLKKKLGLSLLGCNCVREREC